MFSHIFSSAIILPILLSRKAHGHIRSQHQPVYWNSTPCTCAGDSAPTASYPINWNTSRTIEIEVGFQGELAFSPDSVNVPAGTRLRFNFLAKNHTLTQSTFDHPCESSNNVDTGFNQFNPSNTSGKYLIDYIVHDQAARYFYCAQTLKSNHCEAGMVFSVNAGENAIPFKERAMNVSTATQLPTSAVPCGSSLPFVGTPVNNTLPTSMALSGTGTGRVRPPTATGPGPADFANMGPISHPSLHVSTVMFILLWLN